jgi:hypothetical protein
VQNTNPRTTKEREIAVLLYRIIPLLSRKEIQMAQKLTPETVAAPFLGAVLTSRHPGQPHCVTVQGITNHTHRVIVTDFQFFPDLMARFGVTARLKEAWERSGTEICLDIVLDGDAVRELCIRKTREDGACARPCSRGLTPTDQELRIISRILSHLTKA